MANRTKTNQATWLGVGLIFLGLYFLLRNLDFVPTLIPYWIFSWKMIFVVIGAVIWTSGRKEGVVFLLLGLYFLLPELLGFQPFHLREWWPAVLIAIGVIIFIRRGQGPNPFDRSDDDSDYFNDTTVFGGSKKSITSQNFMGGKITSIFGGSDIDFSETRMGKNEIVLDIFCMFGGNEIRIPKDWTVVDNSISLFGSFDDKRKIASEVLDPNKTLLIKGAAIFGGNSVRTA